MIQLPKDDATAPERPVACSTPARQATCLRLARAPLLTIVGMVLAACGGPTTPDPGPPDPDPSAKCAVVIADDITIPTRLTNNADGCDYRVEGELLVTGSLTIDAGTEVQFNQDSRLLITDTGSLHAVGTAAQHVTLRGSLNTVGYWYGLCFGDNRASELVWVDLLNAGKVWRGGTSDCRAAIGNVLSTGEPVSIVDTLVAGAQTTGLDATELRLGTFARNVFAGNLEYGVRVSPANLDALDTASDYSGESAGAPNTEPFVFVGGYLDDGAAHVWPDLGAPYYVGDDAFGYANNVIIDAGTDVTADAGTRFVFGEEGGILIWDLSTFTAIGTANDPVVFTGLSPVPGSWDGLSASTAALHLEHAEVSWGGGGVFYPGNVSVTGVDTVQKSYIRDTLIRGSATCGIYTTSDTADLVMVNSGNVYVDNADDFCID